MNSKLRLLSPLAMLMMNSLEPYESILNPPKRRAHYIEYSGIPSEEQKWKSAERKTRKKAKKEAKRGKRK